MKLRNAFFKWANFHNCDVVITEIGGRLRYRGVPFFRGDSNNFALEVGNDNVLFLHVTLVPYIKAAGELKSKPTQQSVANGANWNSAQFNCRTEYLLIVILRQKLSMFCNVLWKGLLEEARCRSYYL